MGNQTAVEQEDLPAAMNLRQEIAAGGTTCMCDIPSAASVALIQGGYLITTITVFVATA